jgi:hypothetical protein
MSPNAQPCLFLPKPIEMFNSNALKYGFGYGGFMNTFFPTYATEINPTNIRAVVTASGYALFNLIVIMLVQVTPMAIEAISWKYFMIFVICDAIFIVIFYFFFPETKNKTLEEIGALFGDEVCFCSILWMREALILRPGCGDD